MAGCEHVFYASSNGDVWFLVRAEGTDTINVKHQPNPSSGGKVSLTTLQNFLAAHHRPQLIQLIRTMILEALDRKIVPEDLSA
jgi:hypothetical protein